MSKSTKLRVLAVVALGLSVLVLSPDSALANPYCYSWTAPVGGCNVIYGNDGWTCLADCEYFSSGCQYCCTAWQDPAYGICQDYCLSDEATCTTWCFDHCSFAG